MRLDPEVDDMLDRLAEQTPHTVLTGSQKEQIINNPNFLKSPVRLALRVPEIFSNWINYILSQDP